MQVIVLDHLVLRVADTARSARFYGELLDCTVEREVAEIGLVQLRAGDSLIDLVPADAPPTGANLDHFCLRLEPFDLEEIRRRCQRLGIECGEPARRYGATGYGPSVYLTDPDGNRVELKGRGGV